MVKKDNSINVDVFQRVGNDVLKGVHAIDTDINEYINFSRPTINLRDIWLDSHQVSKLWNVNLSYIRTSMKQSPDKWPSHVWKKRIINISFVITTWNIYSVNPNMGFLILTVI